MTDPDPVANDAAKRALAQLEAILANAVDAIITIDEVGIVISMNPATELMFGYAANEVIGQNIKMLMPSPYREEHDAYLANYMRSGQRKIIGIGREVVGRRNDGRTFPMHLAVSEVRVGDKRLFTGIVRDISDLKEAERQLEHLNEELEDRVRQRTAELNAAQAELVKKEKLATLGQISGGIAHEIRNPLNAVKTSAYYLMNASRATPEKVKEHLDRIDRQVTMIDNVVTALADVAKLPDPRLGPVAIPDMLKSIVSNLQMPANVSVELQIADQLPHALGDENQLPIAFRNLIRNARDAMEAGGSIVVTACCIDARKIGVAIKDEGVGIPAEDLPRILEPLYSTKARGMGLGLAITHAILVKNQGELRVESKAGVGSTFTVILESIEEPT